MNRIEVTAILKSAIEAGHPPERLGIFVQTSAGLLDQYGTDAAPQSIPSTPAAGATAPAAAGVQDHGRHKFQLQSIEDHGNRVRIKASGFSGAAYFSAFGDDCAAFRMMQPMSLFSANVSSKPNPSKPGTNYWNLKAPQVSPQATATAQHAAPPDDIPF